MGADPDEVARLLRAVVGLTDKPLDRQVDPERRQRSRRGPRPRRQAEGASAVSLINTLKGMALDPGSGEALVGGQEPRGLGVRRSAPIALAPQVLPGERAVRHPR